jgi:hypothetical protein
MERIPVAPFHIFFPSPLECELEDVSDCEVFRGDYPHSITARWAASLLLLADGMAKMEENQY